MTQSIPLIDKDDGFETIRDTIAAILATETVAQQALATAGGEDPTLWAFKVYTERVNPWEAFRDGEADDLTPIVNVWYSSSTYDMSASNVSTRQKASPSRFNVDIYASAVAAETVTGHTAGDEAASRLSHNIAKLVRNILMHDKYTYLGLRGTVWRRWIGDMSAFQPDSGGQPLNRTAAVRIALDVEHNETVDLEDHETLEIIHIDFKHAPDGQIIAELEYDFSEEE